MMKQRLVWVVLLGLIPAASWAGPPHSQPKTPRRTERFLSYLDVLDGQGLIDDRGLNELRALRVPISAKLASHNAAAVVHRDALAKYLAQPGLEHEQVAAWAEARIRQKGAALVEQDTTRT